MMSYKQWFLITYCLTPKAFHYLTHFQQCFFFGVKDSLQIIVIVVSMFYFYWFHSIINTVHCHIYCIFVLMEPHHFIQWYFSISPLFLSSNHISAQEHFWHRWYLLFFFIYFCTECYVVILYHFSSLRYHIFHYFICFCCYCVFMFFCWSSQLKGLWGILCRRNY